MKLRAPDNYEGDPWYLRISPFTLDWWAVEHLEEVRMLREIPRSTMTQNIFWFVMKGDR